MIEIIKTPIEGLLLIKPKVFKDARGYFFESYNKSNWDPLGLNFNFVQDNQSNSKYGTIRGLHWQKAPRQQSKLVRVLSGRILDVVVDLRKNSKTYKQHFAVELNDEVCMQLLVPKEFAHGFCVLSPAATVVYKCDEYYSPSHDTGISCLDPDLNIDWMVPKDSLLLSEKDALLPSLREALI